MSKLLIHIGYHKTGTSWQQTHLFSNQALGLVRTHVRHDVPYPIVLPHDYDFEPAACRAYFEPAIQKAWQANLTPVVSHERLSGEIHIGVRDSKSIADRLAATFPEAHILMVIREQRAMARSIYGQYIKGSGVWSLDHYLDPMIPVKKRFKYATFHLDHLRYDRPITYYRKLFGHDSVTVLPYELFHSQPKLFVETILQRLGLPITRSSIDLLPFNQTVNPSLSASGLVVKRWLNRFFGRQTPLNTTPLIPLQARDQKRRLQRLAFGVDRRLPAAWKATAKVQMAQAIENKLGDFYVESNRRTAALLDIDLAQYGYRL